jgi:hypothetical protein
MTKPQRMPMTMVWTLDLLVKQGVRLGWIARPVSIETMRQTLSRFGINYTMDVLRGRYVFDRGCR